ncbi:hypothetical protein JYT31_01565 [Beggiatoa alba]|nr:hypothetical protein [Beggiatoa alba]
MMTSRCIQQSVWGLLLSLLFIGLVGAQGIREHTRLKRDTSVTALQAVELTLTLVKTDKQIVQTWVRTAAIINNSKKKLFATLCSPEAKLVLVGQRVRAFPPDSKSSLYQARVINVLHKKSCASIEASLPRKAYEKGSIYVMEIIVNRGEYLSIPNEAIIEEGYKQVVYVQQKPGHYVPKNIRTGLKGELYTQVIQGLDEGDLVVTLGSFFIDADYKLKATQKSGSAYAHHHH